MPLSRTDAFKMSVADGPTLQTEGPLNCLSMDAGLSTRPLDFAEVAGKSSYIDIKPSVAYQLCIQRRLRDHWLGADYTWLALLC